MTATAAPTVKDQELMPFGLVESASVNSFADFVTSNLNETTKIMRESSFRDVLVLLSLSFWASNVSFRRNSSS